MNKRYTHSLVFLGIMALMLTGAWLYRENYVKAGPRYFHFPTHLNLLLIIIICSFGSALKGIRIIYLFCFERAFSFLFGSLVFIFKFNMIPTWKLGDYAYIASEFSAITVLFFRLFIFGIIGFRSWKVPALFLLPIYTIMITFFDPNFTYDMGIAFRNMYVGFYVKAGLVLLSYIAYQYAVKSIDLDNRAMLLLLGWLAIFLVEEFNRTTLSPYSVGCFYAFISIYQIVSVFWIVVILSAWFKGLKNGSMAAATA